MQDQKAAGSEAAPCLVAVHTDVDAKVKVLRATSDIPAGVAFHAERPLYCTMDPQTKGRDSLVVALIQRIIQDSGIETPVQTDDALKPAYEKLVSQGFELNASALEHCDSRGHKAEVKREEDGKEIKQSFPPNYYNRIELIVSTRAFPVTLSFYPEFVAGMSLYETATWSKINCSPNAEVFFKANGTVILIANRDIKANEDIGVCTDITGCVTPHGISHIHDVGQGACDCKLCLTDASKIPRRVQLSDECSKKLRIRKRLDDILKNIDQFAYWNAKREDVLKMHVETERQELEKKERGAALRELSKSAAKKRRQRRDKAAKATKAVDAATTAKETKTAAPETKQETETHEPGTTVAAIEEKLRQETPSAAKVLADFQSTSDHHKFFSEYGRDFDDLCAAYDLTMGFPRSEVGKLFTTLCTECKSMAEVRKVVEVLIDKQCAFSKSDMEAKAAYDVCGPNRFDHKYLAEDDRVRINVHLCAMIQARAMTMKHLRPIMEILAKACDLHGGDSGSKPERPHDIMRTLMVETMATRYILTMCSAVIFKPQAFDDKTADFVMHFLSVYVMPNVPTTMAQGSTPFRSLRVAGTIVCAWTLLYCRINQIATKEDITEVEQKEFGRRMSILNNFLSPKLNAPFVRQVLASQAQQAKNKTEKKAQQFLYIPEIDSKISRHIAEEIPMLVSLWSSVHAGADVVKEHQKAFKAHRDKVLAEKRIKQLTHESLMAQRAAIRPKKVADIIASAPPAPVPATTTTSNKESKRASKRASKRTAATVSAKTSESSVQASAESSHISGMSLGACVATQTEAGAGVKTIAETFGEELKSGFGAKTAFAAAKMIKASDLAQDATDVDGDVDMRRTVSA